jgi:sugar/nucleoside kinase (ribokinase family)
VVGDTAVDYYLRLPRPAWAAGAAADEKITAEHAVRLPGGTGANAAVTAQLLGSEVSLYSAVGDDPYGEWLTQAVAARGVRTHGVRVFHGTSTQATILLAGRIRQVIVDRGVADHLATLTPPLTSSADTVYLTGSGPAIQRMTEAGLAGYVIAGIECGMAGTPGLACALRRAHLVITNTAGRDAFAGQLPATVTVIETQGTQGVTIHYPDAPAKRIPAVPAPTVDATGAGDCLAGALCNYLGIGLELTAAVRLAVAAAALSTRALGAQSALPTDAEVRHAAAGPAGTEA